MSEITFSDSSYSQVPKHSICGDFYLLETKFIVILSENEPKTRTESDVNANDDKVYGSIVGSFQVKEQLYLIVEVKDMSSDLTPNLDKLLTQRELQIATLIALGYSNKQIANRLKISAWTIATHLRRIFIKLDVTNRAAMIYRCASLVQKLLLDNKNNTTDERQDYAS